jgi:hypothetical protein
MDKQTDAIQFATMLDDERSHANADEAFLEKLQLLVDFCILELMLVEKQTIRQSAFEMLGASI